MYDFLIIFGCFALVQSQSCTNNSVIIKTIFGNYNKHKIPSESTEVTVEIWIQEMTSISTSDMVLDMDFYLTETWLDPALNYEHLHPCVENISMSNDMVEKIWTPNTVFVNSKWQSIHKSPYTNLFFLLYPNGTVWMNSRSKIGAPCDSDLSRFPSDFLKCHLTFESFIYNTGQVKMRWASSSVLLLKSMQLPEFTLINVMSYRNEVMYPAGDWDELSFAMNFNRRYGWYILNCYMPSFLAVIISWLSISFGTKPLAGRSFLCIGSYILITMISIIINNNIPRVSYVKASDVWLIGCQFFVFLMVVELAIIGIITRKQSPINVENDDDNETLLGHKKKNKNKGCCNRMPCILDTVCGFGFAALFVLFVIIYWVTYSD